MTLILGLLVAAKITIRLVDSAAVPDATITAAERIAEHILAQAGGELTWLRCPGLPACQADPGPGEFRLLILNLRPKHAHAGCMGFAVIPRQSRERYAALFYPMVQKAAINLDADPAHLLGAGIAHEIGHLLLGSQVHSRTGVMSPHFQKEHVRQAARGELRFTSQQIERLRSLQDRPY
jgi:hypothetical protein